MQWFRLYDELLDDPKVQRLPAPSFRAYVNLLCLASRQKHRGTLPALSDVAFALRLSDEEAESHLRALHEVRLIDSTPTGLRIHGWEGRQHASDDVTSRVQKHRAAKSETLHPTLGNVSETLHIPLHETHQNRTDTEQIQNRAEQNDAPQADAGVVPPEPTDTPYEVLTALIEELTPPGENAPSLSPAYKGKQLAVGKRLLQQGYGADKVRRCIRYLRSQQWRTGVIDLMTVEREIGAWEVNGMPVQATAKADSARASPPMNKTQQLQAEILRQREERERSKANGSITAIGPSITL